MNKKIFILGISLVFSFSVLFAGGKVTFVTLDWEPYIGKKLKKQGYVAQVVREAFKQSGYNVKIDFKPWARVVKLASQGKYDAYGPEYYSGKLKRKYYFSKAFPGGPLGFFKLKSKKIKYRRLKDLKAYKVGVVRGYVNTKKFDSAKYIKKEAVVDDLTNIKKLIKGRIDLFVADKFVGKYLIKKFKPAWKNKIEFVKPVLERKNLYLCFPKKVKDARAKLAAFNKGLKIIKKNGTLRKILRKSGF